LSFLLGFGEAALVEEKIETFACRFWFHDVKRPSGAALDQVFGDFAEPRSAIGIV
jgi:hypothetical protein